MNSKATVETISMIHLLKINVLNQLSFPIIFVPGNKRVPTMAVALIAPMINKVGTADDAASTRLITLILASQTSAHL